MFIEKIHPHTKVIFTMAMIFLSAINDYSFAFFIIIPFMLVLHIFNHSTRTFMTAFYVIIPYLLMLMLIYGLIGEATENNWLVLFNFKLNELILVTILNRSKSVVVIILMFSTLFKHTSSDSMLLAYSKHTVTKFVSFIFMNIKNTLSHSKLRAKNILIAQQTRGIKTKGFFITRLKALWPMIMPLIMNAMIDSQERQLTLYARGFDIDSPRDNIETLKKHKIETLVEILLLGVVIISIIMEVTSWHN